ncbi:MAG: hypothetical protein LW606_05375 [Ilumatobacteraceae bacterium]|nr:hypothetical protein [Ilumatobacteraceae bacterium]
MSDEPQCGHSGNVPYRARHEFASAMLVWAVLVATTSCMSLIVADRRQQIEHLSTRGT